MNAADTANVNKYWTRQSFPLTFPETNKHTIKMQGIETDWRQYAGRWYEQARIPSWFEPTTFGDVTADYIPRSDGSFIVVNRAFDPSGQEHTVVGTAHVDRQRRGTLRVSFMPPFSAPYVVLAHGKQYDWAIVGGPSRHRLWLLTRQPILSPQSPLWREIIAVALRFGYSRNRIARLQRTPKSRT